MTGRRERFQRIYDDNYERILGYALRRTPSGEDAHDVVSDTFLTAWRRLDDVPDGEQARLWLYGTARRVLSNHHRSRRRQDRLVQRLERDVARPAVNADGIECDTDWAGVTAAFDRLSEADREVLVLTGWEGLSAEQIAAVLGCTRTAARVRLHRARKRFTKELAAEGVQRPSPTGHAPGRWASARPDTEEAL